MGETPSPREGSAPRRRALRSRHVDVRIVAATNRDLEHEVQANRFRADLTTAFRSSNSRSRRYANVPTSLSHCCGNSCRKSPADSRVRSRASTSQAWAALLQHSWPGNIRELEHAIERACAAAEGPDILEGRQRACSVTHCAHRQQREPRLSPWQANQRALILSALDRHNGDKQRAAADLGISLSTLRRRLRKRSANELGSLR